MCKNYFLWLTLPLRLSKQNGRYSVPYLTILTKVPGWDVDRFEIQQDYTMFGLLHARNTETDSLGQKEKEGYNVSLPYNI